MRPLYYPGTNATKIKPGDIHKYDNGLWLATPIPAGIKVVIEIDGRDVFVHQQAKSGTERIQDTPFLTDLRNYLGPKVQKSPKFILCGVIAHGGEFEGGFIPEQSLVLTDICQIEGNDLYGQRIIKRLAYLEQLFPGHTMSADAKGNIKEYTLVGYVYNSLYKALSFTSDETCETFGLIADQVINYPFYEGLMLRNPNTKLDYLYNAAYNSHGYHYFKK